MSLISNEKYDGNEIQSTHIQEFYKNQTIFVTGGTGFIGKALIEKLLRCCSGIERIYVLIRKKRDKDLQLRLQTLLEDAVFNKVRNTVPDFEKKVIGIAGDVSLENLGLSDTDITLIKKDVSIIFHSAATVRFTEPLKVAVATNLQSTATILDLCKDMKNLKAFVYVSTAYAHCFNNPTIEEKFYNYLTNYKDFLVVSSLPDEVVEDITPVLTRSWLNTYTCTKALAENFLGDESQNLPVAIFRPPIVAASAYEPMPGWIDNYNGATGIIAGVDSGVLRTIHSNRKTQINLVPVDFCVNALIACVWDVDMQVARRGKNMLIYNFTSTSDAPLTLSMVRELSFKYFWKYPLSMTLWYPCLQLNKMMKLYEKVHKMCDLLEYVGMNEWDMKNENLQNLWNKLESSDKTTFQFQMQSFDWDKYFSNYIKGIRIYLFKDDLKTLNASRSKYKRLFLMNQVMRAVLICSAYYTTRKILEIKRSYKPLYCYQKKCLFR